METLLFKAETVKKFFDILSKQKRESMSLYHGHDKLNPDRSLCGREVFVKRAVKNILGKYIVWYCVSDLDLQYKRYVRITNISFGLGYSDDVVVWFYDYGQQKFGSIRIDHNAALRLEGEWSVNSESHAKMAALVNLNIPKKQYVFRTYDFDKYPKRAKSREEALKKISSTITFECVTLHEAYKEKNKSEFKHQIAELIEVKDV